MATNVEKTAAPALACGRGNQSRRNKSTRNMDESNHEIGLVGKLVKSTLTFSLRKMSTCLSELFKRWVNTASLPHAATLVPHPRLALRFAAPGTQTFCQISPPNNLKPFSPEMLLTRCQSAHTTTNITVCELLNDERGRCWVPGVDHGPLSEWRLKRTKNMLEDLGLNQRQKWEHSESEIECYSASSRRRACSVRSGTMRREFLAQDCAIWNVSNTRNVKTKNALCDVVDTCGDVFDTPANC